MNNSASERMKSFLWVIVRGRYLFFGIIFFAVIFGFILAFSLPKEYTAVASILPSEGASSTIPGFLKNLFPEFGGKAGELTSVLFPDILRSRSVLERVFEKKYTFRKGKELVTKNLYEVFNWKNVDKALRSYPNIIKITTSIETGTIWIRCTTRYPELSAAIVNEMVYQLDDFNKNKLRSHAKDNVEYLTKRLEELSRELAEAEDSLASYLSCHRDYPVSASPEVEIEVERRKRQREIKSQAYIVLYQQLELAKLEAKKDIPVVSVLDWATPPILKSGPKRAGMLITIFLVSLIVAVVVTFATDSSRKTRVAEEGDPIGFLLEDFKRLPGLFRFKKR